MFVQIIEGRLNDAVGMDRQGDRWLAELRPGAEGFLGATIGTTDDGRFVNVVRFASEEAARANSERPEQGQWWAETEKYFDGTPTFTESTDVTEWLGGGSDDAGFVQVMKMRGIDRAQVERFDEQLEPFAAQRPDLIGGIRIWTGPDECMEVAYFTSEADARAGEAAAPSEDFLQVMDDNADLFAQTEYLDLRTPRLVS